MKSFFNSRPVSMTVAALLLVLCLVIPFTPSRTPAQSSIVALFADVNGQNAAVPTNQIFNGTAGQFHFVFGSDSTAGTSGTITLATNAAYTSSTSYVCFGSDVTVAAAVKIAPSSGTSATITKTSGDVIKYVCVGN